MSWGHTRGAREHQRARQERQPGEKTGEPEGQGCAGGGGSRGPTTAQRYTTSLADKHHADEVHLTVPANPPRRQGTDGGEAGGGGRQGNLPEGVPGKAVQVGLQDRGQGGGREARESARDIALARGRAVESTQSKRAAVGGPGRGRRGGGRGEGREEREEREGRTPWPGTAKGHAPRGRTDQRRTPRGSVTRCSMQC